MPFDSLEKLCYARWNLTLINFINFLDNVQPISFHYGYQEKVHKETIRYNLPFLCLLIFYCFYCFWVTCCPYDSNKIMAMHSECAVSQEEETSLKINLSLCTIKINLLHSMWLWNSRKHPCAWLVSLLLYKNLFWFSTSELRALTPPQEKTGS